MKTIGTVLQFAQYQPSLNRTMQKYLLDSHAESEISKINARWNVLEKFESHFTHNVVVSTLTSSDATSMKLTWLCYTDAIRYHVIVSRR
jgi:hypothetical protein